MTAERKVVLSTLHRLKPKPQEHWQTLHKPEMPGDNAPDTARCDKSYREKRTSSQHNSPCSAATRLGAALLCAPPGTRLAQELLALAALCKKGRTVDAACP